MKPSKSLPAKMRIKSLARAADDRCSRAEVILVVLRRCPDDTANGAAKDQSESPPVMMAGVTGRYFRVRACRIRARSVTCV
jgi:hypothetical protein